MQLIVVLCLVAAAVAAPPASSSGAAEVLSYENNNIGVDGFHYAYVQSDGTKGEATGEFHPGSGKDDEGAVVIKGSFEYVGADGVPYSATYVADENGFHPTYTQGQGGAIPDEVLKSLSARK